MYRWLTALLGACFVLPAQAELVNLPMPGKLVAQAEYRPGKPNRPAVLLLHGFLQTREFPTTQRLADNLVGEGYTVLAPTLTLKVPNRKQSLACEAIHTHTFDDDLKEIDAWFRWLKARHGSIVLIGHSIGSVELLAYVNRHPDKAIRKLIGVSIIEGSYQPGERARQDKLRELRGEIAKSSTPSLIKQPFSFCAQMVATPQSLVSYLEWSPNRILDTINRTELPVSFIVGSKDDLMGRSWIDKLKESRAKVAVIQGANHFMDGEHEFALLDNTLEELKPVR